ncbi:MAG: putative baseplate assembly protein [Haloferacaceae archaeon]
MGIDVPTLDDRSYEELVEDLRKRIPIESDEWTDHNAHDPGITIAEMLAWLAESYRYELDQIEERHRRKYLQLLGTSPGPPQAATASVQVAASDAVAGETVPTGTRLVADDGRGERVFETTRDVPLTGARVARVVTDTASGRTDCSPANRAVGTYFRPFGRRARAGSAAYIGFEGDPFADPTAPLAVAVDFHTDDLPPAAVHGDESPAFEPSVELVWEYCTDYGDWDRRDAWERLEVLDDTTDALYGGGVVRLANPGPVSWEGVQRAGPPVAATDTGLSWLRVRLRRAGYEVPPQVDRIRTNVLPVEHRATVGPERLQRTDGGETTSALPHQRFVFDRSPVLDATVTVGGTEWDRVDDFDASGPDDRHYVLDETDGRVRFGDNVRGSVPVADRAVVATSYDAGGGPGGNVAADADWWFAGPDGPAPSAGREEDETPGTHGGETSGDDGGETSGDDGGESSAGIAAEASGVAPLPVRGAEVRPLGPASGGRAAETVDGALARLLGDLDVPYRAVTAADCEYVAAHTPGLRFGRTKAVVSEGPDSGDCTDHDVVEVVVVPYSPPFVDRPVPSEGFLEAVDCHLERHRLVTDRVDAVPPTYVGVGVDVEVELLDGYAASQRAEAVGAELDRFLSPLSGFDGNGWPFGRSVYESELYETVEGVEGVDCVLDVDVTVDGDARRRDGEVDVPDVALVYPTDHTVSVAGDRYECGGVR